MKCDRLIFKLGDVGNNMADVETAVAGEEKEKNSEILIKSECTADNNVTLNKATINAYERHDSSKEETAPVQVTSQSDSTEVGNVRPTRPTTARETSRQGGFTLTAATGTGENTADTQCTSAGAEVKTQEDSIIRFTKADDNKQETLTLSAKVEDNKQQTLTTTASAEDKQQTLTTTAKAEYNKRQTLTTPAKGEDNKEQTLTINVKTEKHSQDKLRSSLTSAEVNEKDLVITFAVPEPEMTSQTQTQTQSQAAAPPQPQMAKCRYRWAKILPTTSQRIVFFSTAQPKETVFLIWSQESGAYFSEELSMPCGDFRGHVIVEGKTYPVEEFNVRSYTFEIDLFLKDDVIEDEVATSNSLAEELKLNEFQQQNQTGKIDTYRDLSTSILTSYPKMAEDASGDNSGIKHATKYEDLLRQQLQHTNSLSSSSLENEVMLSQKLDHSADDAGSKRPTPVGDVGKEVFQDNFNTLESRDDALHGSRSIQSDRFSDRLELNSSRHSQAEMTAVIGMSTPPRLHSQSSREYVGSGRQTPQKSVHEDDSLWTEIWRSPSRSTDGSLRQSPIASRSGSQSSSRRTPLDTHIDDSLSNSSLKSPVRQTQTQEMVTDVLGTEMVPSSSARSSVTGSNRQTPIRDLGLTSLVLSSPHSSSRSTPHREVISASLYSGQNSKEVPQPSSEHLQPRSLAGSQYTSRTHSVASLSSEQELSQYINTNDNNSSNIRRSSAGLSDIIDELTTLPPIARGENRPASLPAFSAHPESNVHGRSFTPDNRIKMTSPGTSELLFQHNTGRVTPFSSSSRTSSRTVTPTLPSGSRENGNRENLEETVSTLRKLLSSREQEVHELTAQLRDLREINQSLKQDLEHARSRRTPLGTEEFERQHQQVLKEKEILASEVVQLRDMLEAKTGSTLSSYSSNNSPALQRKVDDLEAHIRNLHEVNEATMQKLSRSEQRIKDILVENECLRSKDSRHAHDIQMGHSGDHRLQVELEQLKEDVRTLRERNFQLQEENLRIRLGKEQASDDRFNYHKDTPLGRNYLGSNVRSDDSSVQKTRETTALHNGVSHSSGHNASNSSKALVNSDQYLISPRQDITQRTSDRRFGSDAISSLPSRDSVQRFLDPNFGPEKKVLDINTNSTSRPEEKDLAKSSNSYSRTSNSYGKTIDSYHRAIDNSSRYNAQNSDLRKTESGRYDPLHSDRSRPDGEVSEKLVLSDVGKYTRLSSDQLRQFDSAKEQERNDKRVTMSAERLRLLEEAERDREKRGLSNARTFDQQTHTTGLSAYEKEYTRRKQVEAKTSDDSDSTAVLVSYNVKADPGYGIKTRSSYTGSGRSSELLSHSHAPDKGSDKGFHELDAAMIKHKKYTSGDDSDTATDILLSAEPNLGTSRHRHKYRQSAVDSDASLSSFSDPEDAVERSHHHRSKSVEAKDRHGHPGQKSRSLRPASSVEQLGGKTMMLSSGFRTVTPQPLTTQHNKGSLSNQTSLSSSLTQGLRPFAPSSPADMRTDDIIKFSRQGGKLSQGVVKFIGHLPGRTDVYLGVELYKEEGKHDGTFEGVRYFKCKPNKGVFVAFNKVVMAWAPNPSS